MSDASSNYLRFMTNRRFANTVYEMAKLITPLRLSQLRAANGRDLFQSGGFKEAVRPFIHAFLFGEGEYTSLDSRWLSVLVIRLLFARDYFLSLSQHAKVDSPRLVTPQEAEEEILEVLDYTWSRQGMDWLVLHRAGLPITVACPNWQLCESARWASREYGENETWGIAPGSLTQNESTWTLEDIVQLARNLRQRVLRGFSSVETGEPNYSDVEEAADYDATCCIAYDFFRMMMDEDYVHHSGYRADRVGKRLEFAEDYILRMPQARKVTKREAYAILASICTVVWARYGKGWLDFTSNPDTAYSDSLWWAAYEAPEEDKPGISYIKECFGLENCTYLSYIEPDYY